MRKISFIFFAVAMIFTLAQKAHAAPVIQISIDGPIGPGVSSFIVGAIETSQAEDIAAILLSIDTPGGLDSSMREIIQAILDSSKPVICFVAPSGARAASAGTYILMACHVAAMSHGTTIGAATPVSLAGAMTPPQEENKEQGEPTKPGMADKILNDSSAYMRGLAEMRGRPVDWAEKFVMEAASVSDSEALKYEIIDYRSLSEITLLADIHGHKVTIKGEEWILDTRNSAITIMSPTWRDDFLAAISDPNIAYIMLLVGMYGLFFEFSNPGLVVPGIIGAASLIMAMYALQMLPVNYAGLALLALGLALITAEAFVPSFGVLGIGGIVTFVLGSVMLFDRDIPGFQVSIRLIGSIAAISGVLTLFFITMAVRAWRRPAVSGSEGMIGIPGTVIDWKKGEGHVQTHGEVWSAVSSENFRKGEQVRVKALDGLILEVEHQPTTGDEE